MNDKRLQAPLPSHGFAWVHFTFVPLSLAKVFETIVKELVERRIKIIKIIQLYLTKH